MSFKKVVVPRVGLIRFILTSCFIPVLTYISLNYAIFFLRTTTARFFITKRDKVKARTAHGLDSLIRVFFNLFMASITLGNPLIATNKLSLATWGSYYHQDHLGPGTYAFGYDIEDPVTGNIQFKQEERHPNGTITGNYGYVDADGRPYVVTYVSDENGYRAKIEIEGKPAKYYPPDLFSFSDGSYKSKETLKVQKTPSPVDTYVGNDVDPVKKNLLIIPLQGELLDPQIPIVYRLNYPSYYKYVGVNAASK